MIQTVNRVANYLKSIPSLEAVYIVGSFSKGVTSHDIDMLLIGNDIEKQELHTLLIKNLRATASIVNDDSIYCQIDKIDFDFALLSLDSLFRRISDITKLQLFAEHRNWCVGYWMPEGFLYDLKMAHIVFDKSGVVGNSIDHVLSEYETIR